MPDSDPADVERGGTLSRRELIRRAAAAGGTLSAAGVVAVWTAPTVHSVPGQVAAAGTPPTPTSTSSSTTTPPPEVTGCSKYMFNWCWAQEVQTCVDSGAISSGFNQNDPAPECQQSLAENAAGQIQATPSCCQEDDAAGNNLQWHQVPDLPAACVTRTGATCTCGTNPVGPVTFTITCPDCYFGDVTVLHGSRTGLSSGNCGNFSLSSANTGGAPFTRSWTINFPSTRVPIWFKFWVGCGLSVCSPPAAPCTQSSCLPGGQPVANRVLNV